MIQEDYHVYGEKLPTSGRHGGHKGFYKTSVDKLGFYQNHTSTLKGAVSWH
jgi:hypothetical protein